MVAFREGQFAAANQAMSEALGILEKQPKNKYYIFEPSILLAQAYLAVINAALANKDAARAYFAKAEKYLEVIRMDELLSEYRSRMAGI